jgi:hypothetical protein
VTQLGAPVRNLQQRREPIPTRSIQADRLATAGLHGDWPVPSAEWAPLRTDVAREFFAAEHGQSSPGSRPVLATQPSGPARKGVGGVELRSRLGPTHATAHYGRAFVTVGPHRATNCFTTRSKNRSTRVLEGM